MKRRTEVEKDKVIRPSPMILKFLSFGFLEEKMNREGKGGGYLYLEKEFFLEEK